MNQKQFYTSPEVDVLVVRFEGEFLTASVAKSVLILDAELDDWGDIN